MMTRLLALLLVILLYTSGQLDACSCRLLTICERLDHMPVIFLGEVVEGGVAPEEDPWYSPARSARVRVVEAFRGVPKNTRELEVSLLFMPGMCSPNPYIRGEKVLVFTHFDQDHRALADGGCTQSRPSKWIGEDLDTVRKHFRGEMKTEIYGRIASNTGAGLVDFLLSTNERSPIAGVAVVAEANGKKYRAVSDANGKYSITGLSGDSFRLHAERAGYVNREADPTVTVKQGSCTVENFGLWSLNSVEGSVYDQRGFPIVALNVFLRSKESKEKFGKQATTDSHGAFQFTQIDPGEYTVVVSPAGETADSPYLRTANAQSFEVGPTSSIQAITLTLPPPLPTRNLRIHVLNQDGQPLSGGTLNCAQAAKEKEGYPMLELLRPAVDGVVCHALADRAYHIRLERATDLGPTILPNPPETLVLPGREDVDVLLRIP